MYNSNQGGSMLSQPGSSMNQLHNMSGRIETVAPLRPLSSLM
jgi:hypothetical protein